ncbi:hypothetical protein PsorP6_002311 [Peronosclerospora sorghi]|uniref:Uncharacterized protein n=1 Tax=Peronosclerospora sorghi TaxID=230839 RepID=A0ACC0WYB1_9STRA|nr:hypothetical protein PsorP6_002311 [Peronosclerospora sorghi]
MAGFSVVWNIVLSTYLLNEKLSTGTAAILEGCVLVGVSGSHDTPKHRSSELFRLFESRIFVEYAVFDAFLAVAVRLQIGPARTRRAYLVAIYQAFLLLIGLVSGVIFFDEISGMNTRWQLVVYLLNIVTTVRCIIVLSDKHTEHCDPGILSARIIVAKQGEISSLIVSQNDRVKHGVKCGFVDIGVQFKIEQRSVRN